MSHRNLCCATVLALLWWAGSASAQYPVAVRLNGKDFVKAVGPSGVNNVYVEPGNIWIAVSELARAIDGDSGVRHLVLNGTSLYGVTAGGCGLCIARVQQTGPSKGLIAGAIRMDKALAGRPHVSLADVTRALGGEVGGVPGRTAVDVYATYSITAGGCSLCALTAATKDN